MEQYDLTTLWKNSRQKFYGTQQWSFNVWITFLAKGGGPKKRFQYCLHPNSSKHFLYFRAIQRLSGESAIDPALQDNVLLPDDFTEYIYLMKQCDCVSYAVNRFLEPFMRSVRINDDKERHYT